MRAQGTRSGAEGAAMDNAWERHAGWWQDGFTDGADPEYVEQIVPLCIELLDGRRRVVDIGCGEGQLARALAARGVAVVGLDPTDAQFASRASAAGGATYARRGGAAPCARRLV